MHGNPCGNPCFHVDCWKSSFPSPMWWTDYSFPVDWTWHPCKKSIGLDVWVYFWTLNYMPWAYMSVDVPVPHCFDSCSFVMSFEIWKSQPSNFYRLFHDYFGYLGLLAIPYEFEGWLFHFWGGGKVIEILIKIVLNL